ncbi:MULTISPECIES: hypothetical protein [Pantoea]|uniref:hypothetical protein n=1 Tax=Pantoea TaxID=53335 RepID=UPI0009DE7F5A|nr:MULTISPECIES: hypothetical protein [Pantoea]
MANGFTAFINGTSYDVLNSMGFNFIVDIVSISGSGSKSYSYPNFTLSASLIGGTLSSGTTQKTSVVSMSGQTASWSGIEGQVKMVVTASPTSILNYAGFVLNDYSTSPPKFKIAPNFTPFNLCQVVDLTPTYDQILQTNVPAGQPFIAFHRSISSSGFDHVMWTETTQNGFVALQFRSNLGGSLPMTATRIYVFSKVMVNIPQSGFFMYDNGTIVWHQNCLPLAMSVGGVSSYSVPMAITSGPSVLVSIPADPGYPEVGYTRYNLYSAGFQSNGLYSADGTDLYRQSNYQVPAGNSPPPGMGIGPPGVIQTAIYDTYYRQALGV